MLRTWTRLRDQSSRRPAESCRSSARAATSGMRLWRLMYFARSPPLQYSITRYILSRSCAPSSPCFDLPSPCTTWLWHMSDCSNYCSKGLERSTAQVGIFESYVRCWGPLTNARRGLQQGTLELYLALQQGSCGMQGGPRNSQCQHGIYFNSQRAKMAAQKASACRDAASRSSGSAPQ